KTKPPVAPTASQPEPDLPMTPAEEAEIKAIVAEAVKNYQAVTAGKPAAATSGTAAADQPFETRLEAALRTCMPGFENPIPGTAALRQTLLRNTAMPDMAAQAPAKHAA
ncbi:MAG: hypothetical protein ACJ8AI_22135, partial [Rhodopila sp.]